MPINASHEYFEAEKRYLQAGTLDEKIESLEELIRAAPRHKGIENLVAELKTRLRKLREKLEKGRKVGKGKKGIKKEGFQIVFIGKANSGKSLLLSKLTNATPTISSVKFMTVKPELGTMEYEGVRAQVVDLPSVGSKEFDFGIANNADCLLFVISGLNEIKEIEESVSKATGKKIIVINKIDLLDENEKRKLKERCMSKRLNFILVSALNGEGIDELKRKIFESMQVIRVYMKEPRKEKSEKPVVLPFGSTVKDVAETIYKGYSMKVKETRLTGPSGKFTNQKVGLQHKLKDKDVVEFHAR